MAYFTFDLRSWVGGKREGEVHGAGGRGRALNVFRDVVPIILRLASFAVTNELR